jgi:hypothetical protein
MAGLARDDRVSWPDDLYQLLVEAHDGLAPAVSRQLDASLVLLLANHIGDVEVVRQAVERARGAIALAGDRSTKQAARSAE